MNNLKIDYINDRIKEEFNKEIYDNLQDKILINEYLKSLSTKKLITKFKQSLYKNNITDEIIINNIINENIELFIKPSCKANIRGIKFNKLIKDLILSLNLSNQYDIQFEKKIDIYETEKIDIYETDEIPDFYIYDKYNNKLIVGYNQYDLWTGGEQLNRGLKYLNIKTEDI